MQFHTGGRKKTALTPTPFQSFLGNSLEFLVKDPQICSNESIKLINNGIYKMVHLGHFPGTFILTRLVLVISEMVPQRNTSAIFMECIGVHNVQRAR